MYHRQTDRKTVSHEGRAGFMTFSVFGVLVYETIFLSLKLSLKFDNQNLFKQFLKRVRNYTLFHSQVFHHFNSFTSGFS